MKNKICSVIFPCAAILFSLSACKTSGDIAAERANHDPAGLGELERSVLLIVWQLGSVTADQVREELNRPLKDSTVRTVLRRLEEKLARFVIDPRPLARPLKSFAQFRVAQARDALIETRQCAGDADIIERGSHVTWKDAFGLVHICFGEVFGQFEQFDGRHRMQK